MEPRSTLIAVISVGLLVGTAVGAVAQDEPGVQSVAYATGTAGNPQAVVDGTQRRLPDGQLQIRDLVLGEIPVDFSDTRLSGILTIASNGAGRNFVDGHARIEPRTYRITNAGGAWSGSGERVLALSVDQPRPLINHESMTLFGEDGYAGLVAYVFIELANAAPELQAVLLDIDMAPLPDPVATTTGPREITGPQRPTAGRPADAALLTPSLQAPRIAS